MYRCFQDGNDYSPLHLAVKNGHLNCVDFLIKNGGNINIIDNDISIS